MLHLLVRSLPELQLLDAAQRRTLLKSHIGWFLQLKLLVLPIAAGIVPFVGGIQLLRLSMLPVLGVIFLAAGVVNTLYVYAYMAERIRQGLREVLIEQERRGNRIVCLSCGYDLSGSASSICPECGTETIR